MKTISNTKTGLYASLHLKKHRQKCGLFIVEGEKCLFDTIAGFEPEAVIATEAWWNAHPDRLRTLKDVALSAAQHQLARISSLQTVPDVIGVLKIPAISEEAADRGFNANEQYIVLDGVQDPGNVGTIIRTADWFGFRKIYASKDTVDIYNAKTVQATMGALTRVKVEYVDLAVLFENTPGMTVYGTLLDGKSLYEADLCSPGFIVFGNEGNGISKEIRRFVDRPILIPSFSGGKAGVDRGESLNVGVAAAIVMAEFRRNDLKED